jgi:hypothetical protein
MIELDALEQARPDVVADPAVEPRRLEKGQRMPPAMPAADRSAERRLARKQRLEVDRADLAAGRTIDMRRVHAGRTASSVPQ